MVKETYLCEAKCYLRQYSLDCIIDSFHSLKTGIKTLDTRGKTLPSKPIIPDSCPYNINYSQHLVDLVSTYNSTKAFHSS
jgi:hypothetical protein